VNEYGFLVCQSNDSFFAFNKNGQAHSIILPRKCPGNLKAVASFHFHPNKEAYPSEFDIEEAKTREEEYLCVGSQKEVKCYKRKELLRVI
jgi:proteasome lid subunit RPN8/RPN11